MSNDFAVFILSHGRPTRVRTLRSLLEVGGYSGRWYVVIDNEDDTADEYRKHFGDHVLMFDKLAVSKTFDTFDNFKERRTVVYARNACFQLARELGVKYFLELDDDYTSFLYRFRSEDDQSLGSCQCRQLDKLFEAMIRFLDTSGALTVAFAQGGDFVGGLPSGVYQRKLMRKAMNTFFCRTDRPFDFVGRINEDVNTYVTSGMRGDLMFTITDVGITQVQTQGQKGGMTEAYLDSGTYLKSFYTVMAAPSCVEIAPMGPKHPRLHHNVFWENCTPKILNERHKKGARSDASEHR